ncbi:MAG: ATP-binding protein, partial [Gammaproteobacteria bacterium]
ILHVYLYPEGNKWRHSVYMFVDILVTSIVMHNFGEYGVPFFVFYVWLTVGNGFRYGHMELILCAGLSLCGFVVMCLFTPYWREEYLLSVAAVMLLSIIPMYVAIMLKRLQEAKDFAVRANKEKTRFLANISHEIRTPLNAVVGSSDLLDRETDGIRRAQLTRNIKDASASLKSLVEGVLDFSRIESGHVQIEKEAFNLYGLVQSVEGIFSMQAGQGGVGYITDMDIALPPCVCGDVDRLRQILVNLVGNAVKFTPAGEIKTRVSRFQSEEHGEQILFEVIDTGIGIPAAMQARIFERFRQADDSVQRRYGGTGLGTTIAKSLVDLMGGQIGIDSVENKGSRFWFRIPLLEEPGGQSATSVPGRIQPGCCVISTRPLHNTLLAALPDVKIFHHWDDLENSGVVKAECGVIVDCQSVAQEELGKITRLGRKAGTCLIAFHEDKHKHDDYLRAGFQLAINTFEYIDNVLAYAARILDTRTKNNLKEDLARYLKDGKSLSVLVTDDCRLNRHVMKAMLNNMGIESDFASSGPMALEKLRSSAYDLLLLDIQMPGMSGFDVIELYKARNSEDKTIPIIVVTGDATAEIYEKCDQLGVSRCLLKPVDQNKLRYALSSLITPGGHESSPGIA